MTYAMNKLLKGDKLTHSEFCSLLNGLGGDTISRLTDRAIELRKLHFSNHVYIRGLIEFTNYCKQNCYYCGIRKDNKNAARYRLTLEQILDCCKRGYSLGFRTFVLQGGEDEYFTAERMVQIISAIKSNFSDCALTLSLGEKSKETYSTYRNAGADRYLLRHETADSNHYAQLHPPELSSAHRQQCLYNLRELGFQIGAGFMVGSPYQTIENIASDLVFIQELKPHMVGLGPFIPHCDTPFAKEHAGSIRLSLALLSIIRIMLPRVLLPATTALNTLDSDGRKKGVLAGANVIMPNLSPREIRAKYMIYNGKHIPDSSDETELDALKSLMSEIGYEIVVSRGDSPRLGLVTT